MINIIKWPQQSTIKFDENIKSLLKEFFNELNNNHLLMGNSFTKSSLNVTYRKYSIVKIEFMENGLEFKVTKANNGEENNREYLIQKINKDFYIPEEIRELHISKENLKKVLQFVLDSIKMLNENEVYLEMLINTDGIIEQIENINYDEIKNIKETETIVLQKIRIRQAYFRRLLLDSNDGCKICGLKHKDLLIASHIKPWKDCSNYDRVNANNGFLLCPNHDKLFDKGYISFDSEGKIIISDTIKSEKLLRIMSINENIKINISDETKKYLGYHRNNVFEKLNR